MSKASNSSTAQADLLRHFRL